MGTYLDFKNGYSLESALKSVGQGWSELIELAFFYKPDNIKIVQVKEKFGGLQIYTDYSIKPYSNLLSILTGQSTRICEWCGERGTLDTRYSWMLTLCEKDKRKRGRELGKEKRIDHLYPPKIVKLALGRE